MGLIDTHTHLDSYVHRGTLPGVLARARTAGLDAMIAIGTASDDWSLYREVAHDHPGVVHYTVGLHPCTVEAGWEDALAQAERFWDDSRQGAAGPGSVRPVAMGEMGLDRFHLPKDAAEADKVYARQSAAFAEELAIAKRLGCPVVIHSRGAFRECVEMIDASGVDWAKVVFHCFSEGEAEMAELTRRGGCGSFTGILTYKNAGGMRAAAKAQGLARLMIETDAPFLAPMPHRGKPNEPAFLRHTAEFAAAEVFGVGYEELAAVTTANAHRFFGI
ncbi:MAG: TatD family deoxyribonuclease [Opitutaceae bacterium]|nr:TatD family deoxyribonuclease [Opitutaceae bacterium]